MVFTALIMGIAGSLHCVGMCSPLVMAVTNLQPNAIFSRLIYNTGRILTYALLGTVVSGISLVLPLYKYQNVISIALGVSLLVIAVFGTTTIHIPFVSKRLQLLTINLKSVFSKFINTKSNTSLLLLGSINGLLPCGLTFLALSYCLTLQGPIDGFNFMLLFGAGTLPAMLGFTTFFHWLTKKFNYNLKWLTTSMLILSGILLIARVFIIHLPQSPSLKQGMIDIIMCR
jgi:uncharacterized protein